MVGVALAMRLWYPPPGTHNLWTKVVLINEYDTFIFAFVLRQSLH